MKFWFRAPGANSKKQRSRAPSVAVGTTDLWNSETHPCKRQSSLEWRLSSFLSWRSTKLSLQHLYAVNHAMACPHCWMGRHGVLLSRLCIYVQELPCGYDAVHEGSTSTHQIVANTNDCWYCSKCSPQCWCHFGPLSLLWLWKILRKNERTVCMKSWY